MSYIRHLFWASALGAAATFSFSALSSAQGPAGLNPQVSSGQQSSNVASGVAREPHDVSPADHGRTNSESPDPTPKTIRVTTTVEVQASDQALEDGISVTHVVSRDEVLSAAGTFGDFTRYLQVLPGVNANNDWTNEIRVRGGDPAENLFVVDGVEIPNINHFALLGSSGGFTSMVDTSEIENEEVTPGNYAPTFSTRLSALVQIRTRERKAGSPSGQADVGISGFGGYLALPSRFKMNGLLGAHRSVLNMVTDDIGINGVPIYTDGLAKAEFTPTLKDRVSFLNLSGADSVRMTPQPCDPGVSSPIRTVYGGLRSTTGLTWEHFSSAASESVLSLSYSPQNQDIDQSWQFNASPDGGCDPESYLVYRESTRDKLRTISYRGSVQVRSWLYTIGASAGATNYAYQVAQPAGAQSPFNLNPTWTDADSFNRLLTVGQYAQYAQAFGHLAKTLTLDAGFREEEFGLTGAHVFNPRVSMASRLSEHQTLNFDFGRSGQLAPAINILSYAQNARLAPIEVSQFSAGAQIWNGDMVNVNLQTYAKQYAKEPASTQYPSLMLANMVDTLGQQFVWLPLNSAGRGRSYGAELALAAHTAKRFRTFTTVTWARSLYVAQDGITRAGTFDYPVVANLLATFNGFRHIQFSVRDSYTTGHPYTPFNVSASEAQSRGIYDLSRINALRANSYNRLDLDMNRDIRLGKRTFNLHAGVDNALNRNNFMGYVWLDSCHPGLTVDYCGQQQLPQAGVPEIRVDQMHAFPDAAIRYVF